MADKDEKKNDRKLHRKPTPEEMDAKMQESLKELETLDDPEENEEDQNDNSTETTEEDVEVEEPKETEEPEEDEAPEEPKKKQSKKETPEEDEDSEKERIAKRYQDSSREAHILYSKNKKMTDAIEKAGEVAEPTEDELKAEFPEWEEMSDFEQRMAKKDIVNTRKLNAIAEVAKDFKDLDAWNKKVDEFVADPGTLADFPELDGKEEDFRMFAVTKPTRQNVDFEDLVFAFLYEESQKPKPKSKGAMMETGTGGISEKPKPTSNKITVEESIRLRRTDYKKYLHYVRNDMIESE